MSIKDLIRKRICEHIGRNYEKTEVPMKFLKSHNSAAVSIPVSSIPDDILNFKDSLIDKVSKEENYLYFTINKQQLIKQCLSSQEIKYKNFPRKIIVEYSSPNIAKPFHFGHLRSTIVGHFVSNILSKYENVVRLNYLGDWGTQMGFVKLGLDVSVDSNPIKMMYEAYIKAYSEPNNIEKAREIFYKLESDDSKETSEWFSIKKSAVDNLKETYKILGIEFDDYSCESDFRSRNIQNILNYLKDNKIAFFNNGQMGMDINGVFTPLLRKDGTSLYLSRDIAAALDRHKKYGCDKILYVVDKGQSNHLENLKKAVEIVTKNDLVEHVPFGKVIGMSTRKGTSIFLDDILDCVCQKMSEQQNKSLNTKTSDFETTRTLGLSALFIYILKLNRQRDFKFDWDAALQGTGDSGVKLQYTHCRLVSLEEKFKDRKIENCEASLLQEDIVLDLVILLSEFDETLLNSKDYLESYYLVKYLFKLCNLTAKALKLLPVKNEAEDIGNQRLLLFKRVRQVLHEGMSILGLKPLEKM